MTLQVKIANSCMVNLVRHLQHPNDSKNYYMTIVIHNVFQQAEAKHLNGPLEIHFFDNHFSNIDFLDYKKLHKLLSKFFCPVVFLSQNYQDVALDSQYFQLLEQLEPVQVESFIPYVKKTLELSQPLIYTESMKMFGLYIARPDVHRLAMLAQMHMLNLIHSTDCRLGFSRWHLGADEAWRESGIDLCCKMMNISHLDLLDIIDTLPKSDRFFQDKGKTIMDGGLSDLELEKNMLNQNFVIEIVCDSSFNDNIILFTEKIFRCWALQQPFIYLGPRHHYQKWHDAGIKTFDHIWNENWDNLNQQELRSKIFMIGNTCKEINEKWTSREIYEQTREICIHNYNVVKEKGLLLLLELNKLPATCENLGITL